MLLVDVPKVEVEITHRGLASIAHDLNILDDLRTEKTTSVIFNGDSKEPQTIECSFLSQLNIRCRQEVLGRVRNRSVRFPCIQRSEGVDFHSLYMLP